MSAAPDSPKTDPIQLEGEALGSAVERLRKGEDAIFIMDEGREVAAVLSIDEYRRFAEYQRLEDEFDAAAARAILDDPDEEWVAWDTVRDELNANDDDADNPGT